MSLAVSYFYDGHAHTDIQNASQSVFKTTTPENYADVVINARLILDADKYSPSSPLFDQLEWETFDKIVQEKQATMVFKALNNLTPDDISNLFKPTCTNTNHSLRSKTSNKLHVPAAHHKSLRFNGPKSGILYPMKHAKQQQ